jgi:hypothetical protein
MRFARILVFALLAVGFVALSTTANAQTGYIAVYFDNGYSIEQKNCPGPGVFDTLTVAMVNWNMNVGGVQFAIDYPPEMIHIADFNQPAATIGATPVTSGTGGFAAGFPLPQNGFFPVFVTNVLVQWNCADCSVTNIPVPVVGHAGFGDTIIGTRWPDAEPFPGLGLTALICATVPTEETTWGKVKSLYTE